MTGTRRKLARLFNERKGKNIILPFDHGASEGMIAGLETVPALLGAVEDLPVDGVILNKGMARSWVPDIGLDIKVIIQLSAGTRHGLPTYNQSLVCSVAEALRLGADAVSVHINIGNELEDRMLQDFGQVTEEAHQLGVPVLAVIYARGGQIVNESDPSLVAHCIRLGGELGADIVCTPYADNIEQFSRAVAASPVPVLVAGGPLLNSHSERNWKAFRTMITQAMQTGISGIVPGRNIFQHPQPRRALEEICALVHGV